jgi:hypothetical protein
VNASALRVHVIVKLSIIFDHETATKKPDARFPCGVAARDTDA